MATLPYPFQFPLPTPTGRDSDSGRARQELNFEGATHDGSLREALGQRVHWWLCQWAGWPPPKVRLTKARWFSLHHRDVLCVEWLRSDGLVLAYAIDGLILRQQQQRGHSDVTAVARRLAYDALLPNLTRPPWELLHA